jgi:hypothetical protein
MAAPFPTTYFLGLATAISNVGINATSNANISWTELSGGSYARLACGFTGTALSGLTQTTTAWVVATAPTPAVPILYGVIFDSLTLGNPVAYWNWSQPYTTSLTAMPIQTINISFMSYIQNALNMALLGGQGSSGSLIDAGSQIGFVGGQPLLAGSRLGIVAGGTLVPHLGQGQWIGSADVQGTLSVNTFVGSVSNGITALSGGGTAGATPVLGSYFNRITTSAASLDSVILPALSLAPVGTVINVANDGTSLANVFADVGSSVNASGTLTIGLGPALICSFTRVSPILWKTMPKVPS